MVEPKQDIAGQFKHWEPQQGSWVPERPFDPPKKLDKNLPFPEREYGLWETFSQGADDIDREKWNREWILDRVPSAIAKDLIIAAHKLANSHGTKVSWLRSKNDYLRRAKATIDAQQYRWWIYRKLTDSDLAQQLCGGRDTLPDIYERLREPWRTIERFNEPRNHEQLIQHVARHLDWYLDRTAPIKPPIKEVVSWLVVLVFFALFFSGVEFLFSLGASGIVATVLTWLFSQLWGKHRIKGKTLREFHHARPLIQAAELYYYLVATFIEEDNQPTSSETSQ